MMANRNRAPEIRQRRSVSEAINAQKAQELTDEDRRIDALHARVFATEDGRALLSHLRQITIERRSPPESSDGALREAEAERRFVAKLEHRAARHLLTAAHLKETA